MPEQIKKMCVGVVTDFETKLEQHAYLSRYLVIIAHAHAEQVLDYCCTLFSEFLIV